MSLNFYFLWNVVFLLINEISGQENENIHRKMCGSTVNDIKSCPEGEVCVHLARSHRNECICSTGLERNLKTGKCIIPNSCDPADPEACNARKKEECLPHLTGTYHTCQCPTNFRRHPVTGFCLLNECSSGQHDCHRFARCMDTDNGYICICLPGFIDQSPNPSQLPGRICLQVPDECQRGIHNCSVDAICVDTDLGYLCQCKTNFVDLSPNPQRFPGVVCKKVTNECAIPALTTCHPNATCVDTVESYICICNPPFIDRDPLRNPGHLCEKVDDECTQNIHDCSPNADCIDTEDSYICSCRSGYVDVSADPISRSGRRCLRIINECQENRHDCSPNARCIDTRDSYQCQCHPDFVDESPNPLESPGRICRLQLVDECSLCSPHAFCTDRGHGFTCRCGHGYLDESFNWGLRPGHVCTLKLVECQVHIINSCDINLSEVCRLVNGEPKCTCPENYRRDPNTNACSVIDECLFPQLHDCSQNANCVDNLNGYTCQCKEGFSDRSLHITNRPGRICTPNINECQFDHLNDCHQYADCTDLEEGYQCNCKAGFQDISPTPGSPGRACKLSLLISSHLSVKNECLNPSDNDCDQIATCTDTLDSYRCECPFNSRDFSPNLMFPGRVCIPHVNECTQSDCHAYAICIQVEDSHRYSCRCRDGYRDESPDLSRPGRICRESPNECLDAWLNDCDPLALCQDTPESYTCQCRVNSLDQSPDPRRFPGRKCVLYNSECQNIQLNNCSRFADCFVKDIGYECQCKSGYSDMNPASPGRNCIWIVNKCLSPNLNDCDPLHAECQALEGGYTCRCRSPYRDESPDAINAPGRICRFNECGDHRFHDCHPNAICQDTDESYVCHCKEGFIDDSDDFTTPGRHCVKS